MTAPSRAERATIAAREFARRENIDEKEVRRAITDGRLSAGPNGRPFEDQVGIGWHKPRRDSRKFAAQIAGNVRSAADSDDPEQIVEQANAFIADVLDGRFKSLPDAITAKENALACARLLDARQRAGSLVDKAAVQDALFRRARGERDNLLNWPGRVAPLIAADLGIEPDRLAELMAEHVHRLLADMGEPDLDLEEETVEPR